MHICWFFVLLVLFAPLSLIESSFLFGLFDTKSTKCDPPFAPAPSLEGSLRKIWHGFWSCPYEPTANPGQTIDNFIRYFYIESGQPQYTQGLASDIAKLINKNNSNFIITHGFNDGVKIGEWMETTGKKIISNENNSNVILMDYSEISDCNYMYLATKVVYELSESLANSIKQWDLDLNRTRIIGFSVGAHIAGLAGTLLKGSSGEQLAQIDALDPAGPFFDATKGINNTCAKFVQILHTSKVLGTQQALGHADFYANKLKSQQPGCMVDTCCHSRATELYYASCFKENLFIGTACDKSFVQSQFGFYNDGKSGCFQFDTSECFGYAEARQKQPIF